MLLPTKVECVQVLREHFGIGVSDIVKILNTPTHPKGLRDEIAMEAISGIVCNYTYSREDLIAQKAYRIADAMLEQRERTMK